MKMFIASMLCLVLAASALPQLPKPKAGGKQWALLVAGSNGYYNYRHQSDICHSYQILHAHGIPDENIVVMMYDDIAQNSQNPVKGSIINHVNGPNVYPGVPKDYTGRDVTPENFLKILQGEKPAGGSGKVINSGPDDHVFVYFSDHGATGLIAFPVGILTVKQLNDGLMKMYNNKRYGQLVFYLEACEAGSMFEKVLPSNINIYATTAANAVESSYACYYDSSRNAYLGDHYSVNWMEDSDKNNIETETLKTQFETVKKLTDDSHCMEYGDMSINTEFVGEFEGPINPSSKITYPEVPKDVIPARDVPLAVLKKRLAAENSETKKVDLMHEITQMLTMRELVDTVVDRLVFRVATQAKVPEATIKTSTLTLSQLDCHHEVATAFHETCFNLSENPYAMKFVRYLANMCELGVSSNFVVGEMKEVCANTEVRGVN